MRSGGCSEERIAAKEREESESERELRLRRQIDRIFQSVPLDKIDHAVLRTLMNNTESTRGLMGYIGPANSLVVTTASEFLTGRRPNSKGHIVVPHEDWLAVWDEAIQRRTVMLLQEPIETPLDPTPMQSSLVMPIIYRETVLGLVHLGNRTDGYDSVSLELVTSVGTQVAPFVYCRAMWDCETGMLRQTGSSAREVPDRAPFYLTLMSQDIRNQLQGILASTAVLHELPDNTPGEALVDAIDRCVGRCASLISKVEITEDLSTVPLKRRSLIAALKASVQELSKRYSDAAVEVRYHTEDAVVRADEYLEELLWNILENAVLHNHGTGRRVWILVTEENGGFRVSVADNGAGISDSDKVVLFDMRRRLHGIGIPQVCHLTDKYGGTIEVHDRIDGDPTKGAEFRLWLPCVET